MAKNMYSMVWQESVPAASNRVQSFRITQPNRLLEIHKVILIWELIYVATGFRMDWTSQTLQTFRFDIGGSAPNNHQRKFTTITGTASVFYNGQGVFFSYPGVYNLEGLIFTNEALFSIQFSNMEVALVVNHNFTLGLVVSDTIQH